MIISIFKDNKEYILFSDNSENLKNLYEKLLKNKRLQIQFILRIWQFTNKLFPVMCQIFINNNYNGFLNILNKFNIKKGVNPDLIGSIQLETTKFCHNIRGLIRTYF